MAGETLQGVGGEVRALLRKKLVVTWSVPCGVTSVRWCAPFYVRGAVGMALVGGFIQNKK